MKITRISKIREHRIFRDFCWPNDLHCFDRFNLIYGWNGCGKTTLSSLFAHIEKKTNLDEGEVEFEIDGDRKCTGKAISDTTLPAMRVFNRDFINATINAVNEGVEPIYYLGEDSFEKQREIDQLKEKKRTASEELKSAKSLKEKTTTELDQFLITKAKSIKEALAGSHNPAFNNYNKRKFKQSIQAMSTQADAKSAILSDESKLHQQQQKNAHPKDDLPKVALTAPDIAKISSNAEALLQLSVASNTIDALVRDKALAGWVQTGLTLHSDENRRDTCQFCSQPLTEERRAALDQHFNDALVKFQREMHSTISSLDDALARLNDQKFPDPARLYEQLQREFTSACSEAKNAIESTSKWLKRVRTALKTKLAAPFAAAKPNDWKSETPAPNLLPSAITKINTVLEEHAEITGDFRSKVADAYKQLEQHYVAKAWNDHSRLVRKSRDATSAVEPIKEKVQDLQRRIDELEGNIIEHRKPADELNNELRAYLGRDELRFEIKGTGYSLTRSGTRATHLSEGERTAIAFLYFLKSLQDRSFDLENGVVVIDDPISSLDANAIYSAFGYMKDRTKSCGQLFVLTHNFAFFRQVKNWFHYLPNQKKKKRALRPGRFFLLRTSTGEQGKRSSAIGPLDRLLQQFNSEYHYLFRRVFDEAMNTSDAVPLEHYYAMPNIARRLVESFLAFRYPGYSGELTQSFEQVDFDKSKKTRILRFLHTHSHSGGIAEPEHDPSILAETQPVLAELLDMIKAIDPMHYDGMEKLLKQSEDSN